jgi:hypothetical protein
LLAAEKNRGIGGVIWLYMNFTPTDSAQLRKLYTVKDEKGIEGEIGFHAKAQRFRKGAKNYLYKV